MTNTTDLAKIAAVRRAALSGEMRRRRLAACAKVREVADALGVAPTAVSGWERGLQRPTGENALRWEQVLAEIEGAGHGRKRSA